MSEAQLVQAKLRFSEGLHRQLVKTAERNGRSLNQEVIHRLQESIDLETGERELQTGERGIPVQQAVRSLVRSVNTLYAVRGINRDNRDSGGWWMVSLTIGEIRSLSPKLSAISRDLEALSNLVSNVKFENDETSLAKAKRKDDGEKK
jgi:hypothetical protein